MSDVEKLEKLAKLVRYFILKMTTKAGSGHPTSSLSAADIMVGLFFNKLRFDLKDPQNPANDRVIFSKGHASPLLYALYAAAGELSEKELDSYRQFKSPLEGHPTPNFKFAEVATGSLCQGLSIGLGMALSLTTDYRLPKVYVLMGDSEVSEGSVWEAMELASYYSQKSSAYKLGNLVGIIDVNRLGQSGETMLGWDTETYKKRIEAFGWQAQVVNGHDFYKIVEAFESIKPDSKKPQMIIAKTIKGKGVSFLENKEGWHGKALGKEDYEKAVAELGEIDKSVRGEIKNPAGPVSSFLPASAQSNPKSLHDQSTNADLHAVGNPSTAATRTVSLSYKLGDMVATRRAYGKALVKLGAQNPNVVVLDAETKNSTYSELFKEKFPERFFEMFIAEQNMVSTALGLSARGMVPFVSTFAAFFTRAFDQIRMTAYSRGNVKFMGSHAGVSIGEDGPSQMGLEDISLFRAVFGSVVLNPSDAVSCEKLVFEAANHQGIVYIRTARPATPVIYEISQDFKIGGSKIVRSSKDDKLTIVACGVVLIEALKAADQLVKKNINARVIDAYSIKPIDESTLKSAAKETKVIITIEDHYPEGGLGDAVLSTLANEKVEVHKLSVSKLPMSGKSKELLDYGVISSKAIVKKVLEILYSPC